ncbi:MAG: Eco57I restriction-modification methylase domain-containing protein [Treponema sp.]|nr:Eco57I restriction-modification methylase domain-containing protein [Treponema sp.]
MKFDAIVGNPPYQEEGINNGRKQPLYYLFMNKSFELSKIGALITPARFLFNAGETPKEWNKKMLNDEHFSVIKYYSNSNDVFPAVEIKGGIALSIRNENAVLKKIDIFTAYDELNNILQKVNQYEKDKNRMESIVSSQGVCRFTAELFEDFPQIEKYAGERTGDKILSKVVETGTEVFSDKKFQDAVEILAKGKSARIRRFIKAKYIQKNEFIDSYNVLVPESNGNGAFETFSSPEIAQPNEAFADTFLAVGSFSTKEEAENCMKYIKTKFARALLGVLKVTQHNPKSTWKYVPLQDFTANSDIDWSKPIAAIDRQLYKKYNLDATEIAFIEKNVREME